MLPALSSEPRSSKLKAGFLAPERPGHPGIKRQPHRKTMALARNPSNSGLTMDKYISTENVFGVLARKPR